MRWFPARSLGRRPAQHAAAFHRDAIRAPGAAAALRVLQYLSSEGLSGRTRGLAPLGSYCTLAPTHDVERESISAGVYTLPQIGIVAAIAACVALCAWLLLRLAALCSERASVKRR